MSKVSYLTKIAIFLAATAFVTTTLVACSGDDDDTGPADSGAKTGSGGGTAATGSGGSTGGGGTSGTVASSCVTEVAACNCSTKDQNTTLPAILASSMCIKACCTTDNKCGSSLAMTGFIATMMGGEQSGACLAQDQPGNENASCPKYFEYMAQGYDAGNIGGNFGAAGQTGTLSFIQDLNYKGCCLPTGVCGFLVANMKLGCLSASDLATVASFGDLMGGGDATGTTNTPINCTP